VTLDQSRKSTRVLVTDGAYTHTLGIVRWLGRAGLEVAAIGTTAHAPALQSRFCRQAIVGPPPNDSGPYLAFLERTLAHGSFDVFIPVGAVNTRLVSRHRARLAPFVRFEVAEPQSIETALNKRATYALAQELGVPYPRTIYPQSLAEVEKLSTKVDYPLVIKAVLEEGANVVRYPQNRSELLTTYVRLCEERGYQPPHLPMLQEFVFSDDIGYSFSALYQHGKCRRVFMYRELRSFPIRGGSSSYAESFFDADLKAYGLRLLDALQWHGVAQMDFRRAADGTLHLMEINPKFWASLEVALAAGVNFPLLLCRMAAGEELTYSEEYQRGLRYHWPMSRELRHIAGRPRSLPAVLGACLDPRVKSNIWLSDLRPNLTELQVTLDSVRRHLPGLLGLRR